MSNSAPLSWINSLTAELPREERDRARLEFRNMLQAAARTGEWDSTKTGVIQADFADRSGHVRIDASGIHIYSDTAETMWLKSIGDMLIGSNITAASTTNFVFLSTAQTYNSEALGAGDLLIGDNSASKANMLWDVSDGILYFRGGTTNQAWIDTDGSLTAGGGDVVINSNGILIDMGEGSSNKITWVGAVAMQANIYAYSTGTTPDRSIFMPILATSESSSALSRIDIHANVFGSDEDTDFQLTADGSATNTAAKLDVANAGGVINRSWWAPDSTTLNTLAHNVDTIIKGDTATSLVVADAGLDAFQIGTTVAGVIADFRAASIVLNEGGADMDIRAEAVGQANAIFVQGSNGYVGIGTASPYDTLDVQGSVAIKGPRPWVDVRAYGAVGDGSTNDDTEVGLAVAAVGDGGVLYFPAGTYVLTATIAFASQSVTIRGDGPRTSILQFTGCNGITITHSADTQFSSVRDLAVITATAGTYVGINIIGFEVSSSIQPHLLIDNVYLLPSNPASHYWADGILLTDVWNGTIRSCYIRGNNTYSSATNGIRIDAETVDVNILDCKIWHYATGIKFEDDTSGPQGVRIHQCIIIEVDTGVDHNTPTNGGLGFEFVGGHISAYDYGIRLAKVPQSNIQGVLIYKTGGENFVGIELTTSQNSRIVGAMVRGSGVGTEIGINLKTGSTSCSIVGCSVNDQDTAILLDSGADNNSVVGNTGAGNTADITDNGTGNNITSLTFPN